MIARLAVPFLMVVALAPAAAAQITTNPAEGFIGHPAASGARPRSGCRPVRQPARLPGLSAVVDSAVLLQRLADFSRENPVAGDSTPFALYSLNVSQTGATSLRAIDYWLPAGEADAFAALVREAIERSPQEGTVRLHLVLGERPTARLEQSQECPPEIRGDFRIRTGEPQVRRTQPRLRVRARVAADGTILSAQILRSSGDLEIDRWVQSTLGAGSARPGLVDGIPSVMEVEQEIRVRVD